MRRRFLLTSLFCLGVAALPWRPAAAASCTDEIGAAKADLYVRECLAVTSATNPPCNAANSCAVIGQHIQEMCAGDSNAPGWCQAYAANPTPNPPPPLPVTKPGFDCAKAATPVEREICTGGNDSIADDDRAMADLYRRVLAGAPDAADLRKQQLDFVRERQRCADPEPAQVSPILTHCIAALTHERLGELQQRADPGKGPAWSAYGPSDCMAVFGDDGWDQLHFVPSSDRLTFAWLDMRQRVLAAGDTVAFDIDGTHHAARLEPDSDGNMTAVAIALGAELAKAGMVRVVRNGKILLRASLADFAKANAKTRALCAGSPAR